MTEGYSNKLPSPEEMIRKTQTDLLEVTRYALMIALGAVIIGLVCRFTITPARSETSSIEWLAMVAAIQRQTCPYKENKQDRLFLDKMANLLTLDEPPELNWRERKWLLALKRECLEK